MGLSFLCVANEFSTKPYKSHNKLSKEISQYLRETKDWGIKFKRSVDRENLKPATLASDVIPDEDISPFPVDINQPKLITFVDAVYEKD